MQSFMNFRPEQTQKKENSVQFSQRWFFIFSWIPIITQYILLN
jgi:hypothetical protein